MTDLCPDCGRFEARHRAIDDWERFAATDCFASYKGQPQEIIKCRDLTITHLRRELASVECVERRMREGRQLLRRMVKYVREDRAETPGSTRLERLTAKVDDYLTRTHRASDVLRDGGVSDD